MFCHCSVSAQWTKMIFQVTDVVKAPLSLTTFFFAKPLLLFLFYWYTFWPNNKNSNI